jgi:hypothetical protein
MTAMTNNELAAAYQQACREEQSVAVVMKRLKIHRELAQRGLITRVGDIVKLIPRKPDMTWNEVKVRMRVLANTGQQKEIK